ncbi:response regulator [Maribacter sp. MMG018]|uniref:ATP-binding protein n=1 Tax=Maribacter sp. MMG018 TaxID=2822688 RepID=UPI001B36227B|nr:ATP-binding protein [Maribacter sp. MMG018]MBQ4914578.1 response regulator [Maribacter sp. MMG018]
MGGFAQSERSNFVHLSRNFLAYSDITYDDFGFVWISGAQGLYKYDGYDFELKPYTSYFGDGFSYKFPVLLHRDSNKRLWIASTLQELSYVDEKGTVVKIGIDNTISERIVAVSSNDEVVWFGTDTGKLYYYGNGSETVESVGKSPNSPAEKATSIVDIAVDTKNNVWASFMDGTIHHYNADKKLWHKVEAPVTSFGTDLIKLEVDKNDHLWIATELHGLLKLDPEKKEFIQLAQNIDLAEDGKYPMFITLYCDSSGIVWAGTDGDGFFRIDPNTDQVDNFKPDPLNKFSISNATITNVGEDASHNIWVVTKEGQIDILPKVNPAINYYSGSKEGVPTKTLSIMRTPDSILWFGSDGKGLTAMHVDGTKTLYSMDKGADIPFKGKFVQSMAVDSLGNLWVGTYQNGLWVLKGERHNIPVQVEVRDGAGHKVTDIRTIFVDSKGRVWTASRSSLNIYNDRGEVLAIYDNNKYGLSGKVIDWLIEDNNGNIWISQEPGMFFRFDESMGLQNPVFEPVAYHKSVLDKEDYSIIAMDKDSEGKLWLLTKSRFLIKFDPIDRSYLSLREEKGLSEITITSILTPSDNELWLGSSQGIHHYDLETKNLESYYRIDGLQGNSFLTKSVYRSSDGQLYFGGADGVSVFKPESMEKKDSNAKLYITQIEVLNKPIQHFYPSMENSRVEFLDELKLEAGQTSFSFQFTALDNVLAPNYQYAYRLKGFDEDWIEPKSNRIATYTNIPYGDYVFEVRAGSKKGIWDLGEKQIKLYIAPPWWQSNWAYLIYGLLALAIFYGVYEWLILKYRLQQESWKGAKEKEMYDMKVDFFVKMSHEVQTPLTLILAPIDDMLNKAMASGNDLLKNRLHLIRNNAKRLSRIASELTNLRDKEVNKLQIRATKNNFIANVRSVVVSFEEQAAFKQLNFNQHYPKEDIVFWYDRDKIEHVIYNLLSNAIKFTPSGGEVSLVVEYNKKQEFVALQVSDSGPGIPVKDQEKIFKLFYRSDLGKQSTDSSGIGLALAKELIELHHGEISVDSKQGKGSTFRVKLFTRDNLLSSEEKLFEESRANKVKENEHLGNIPVGDRLPDDNEESKGPTILVIEDHVEMQMFLKDELRSKYQVRLADNGKKGVELAKEILPDLIICDVMMPEMNGIEVCERLQEEKSTATIPIILLTAVDAPETRIAGYKSGAISYVQKPFNFRELSLVIQNIMSGREKAMEQLKGKLVGTPLPNQMQSKEDVFISELVAALNEHLEEPDFRLEDLANTLNMSYSVIYRKCHKILGKSLVELHRTLKLKRAAQLIIESGYGVSEAAFIVGYKDAKYFSQCFKKAFGKSPSALKKEVLRKEGEINLEDFGIKI